MALVSKIGKKWALTSQSSHHRTDIAIKNRYFVLKRKEQKVIRNNLFSQLSKKKKKTTQYLNLVTGSVFNYNQI